MEGYTKYKLKKKTIEKMVDGEMKNAGVEKIVDMKGKGAATKGLKFKVRQDGRSYASRQNQKSHQRS